MARACLEVEVRDRVRDRARDRVGVEVWVDVEVRDTVRDRFRDRVRDRVRIELGKSIPKIINYWLIQMFLPFLPPPPFTQSFASKVIVKLYDLRLDFAPDCCHPLQVLFPDWQYKLFFLPHATLVC